MYLTGRKRTVLIGLVVLMVFSLIPYSAAFADGPLRIDLTVDTAYGWPGEENVSVDVYLNNYLDTISALQFWILLEQPDLIEFVGTGEDLFDTAGTLLSGWEHIDVRSLGGYGYDILVSAYSSIVDPLLNPVLPQTSGLPLIKLKADCYNIADTTTDTTVILHVQDGMLDYLEFSDIHGNSIGVITETILDTNYFNCLEWMPPPDENICIYWEQVSGPPADSTEEVEILWGHLDDTQVHILDGALIIRLCGDCQVDKKVNLLDIVYLINYKYKDGPPPVPLDHGDVNSDGNVNILDIISIINYKYKNGPAPVCPSQE